MTRFTKLLSTILALTLLVALPVGSAFAGAPVTFNLIAGQNINVGTVTVSDGGGNLMVSYQITEAGWTIVQAHMYADVKAPKKGSPGQFPFHSGPVHATSYAFTVPLAGLGVSNSNQLYVAAHAVVNNENNITGYTTEIIGYKPVCPTLEDIAAALPELPSGVTVRYDANTQLFTFVINDGTLAGTYTGYCIDDGHYIWPEGYGGPNGSYNMMMYSSYEELPESITTAYAQGAADGANGGVANPNIDNTDNLDLVNWVINNRDGFNDAEVQHVIWALVDDLWTRNSLSDHEKILYDAAVANGEGFVPGNGGILAVILQPVDVETNSVGQVTIGQVTIGQVTFAQLGLPGCTEEPLYAPIYQSDTGWATAEGGILLKGGWGSYYTYILTE